jgi:protein O-mannosyl-transferase
MANIWSNEGESKTAVASKWLLPLALLLIAGLTVAVYWPVLHNNFIDFDDDVYVTSNMMVQQGLTFKGFVWAFSTFHAGNWHPLTWLSHMLDIELFALNPMGHHATSLLLHAVNSALLFLLLNRLTGFIGRSMVVALLFALHPLHVESVAWVAERKDVLSTLFWILTIWAYTGYVKKRSLQRYLVVAVLFALGLLAKQMLVTLPLVLLLIDYWPLNRLAIRHGECGTGIKALLVEKIPLVAISAAASLVILQAHASSKALFSADGGSIILHSGNALLSYVRYIRNMFWPVDLALFYPFDPSAVTALKIAGAILLLSLTTGFAVWQGGKRPYLIFGWFWYLITLLPVIGFIRVGGQALADRYTYIPLIGLFVILAWGGAEAAGKWRNGLPAAGLVTAIAITVLSVLTFKQIRYWQNSYNLFDHALVVVERNWLAHNNMGILLAQHNRLDEAIHHFQESVRINPGGAAGFRNLGNAYQATGRYPEAFEAFRNALRINPDDVEGHVQLGYAYLMTGNLDLAYQEYLQLRRLNETLASSLLDSIQLRAKH